MMQARRPRSGRGQALRYTAREPVAQAPGLLYVRPHADEAPPRQVGRMLAFFAVGTRSVGAGTPEEKGQPARCPFSTQQNPAALSSR